MIAGGEVRDHVIGVEEMCRRTSGEVGGYEGIDSIHLFAATTAAINGLGDVE